MKKILFLLLYLTAIASYGQADFPEGVQISGGQPTTAAPVYLTTTDANGLQGKIPTYDLDKEERVPVNDVSYVISGTGDKLIAYTAITADRTVTLPPATSANQRIWITDESGLCSNARRIIVQPNGSDTISGDVFSILNFPNGSGLLVSNGAGKWNIISTTSVQFSAGVSIAPSYTNNGNGSVTLGTGVYALYANANGTGRPKAYQVAGGTFTMTDNSTNYIYAQYNTTTGVVSLQQATTDAGINDITTVPIFSIYRQGLTLHARDFDTQGIALTNKINRSIQKTQTVRVEPGGILLGETTSPAVRTITVSAGTAWVGATEISLPAINSATSTCYRVYPVAGVYQTTTTVTQYDNQQYSDGTNLQTLTTNNYGVRFVYRSIGNDNDMAIVVGIGNNSLGQAQVSEPPANLPSFLNHMTLVGRIIFKKGDDFATEIKQNIGGAGGFATAGVTDHNALFNLQKAQSGVNWGHIDDLAQSISGNKTFLGNTTFSGSTTLSPNAVGVTSNKLTQVMAVNDYWSIYGDATVTNRGKMVFEIGDDGAPIGSEGQSFEFRYMNQSSGSQKTPLLIDYNSINMDANIGIGNNTSANNYNLRIGANMTGGPTSGAIYNSAIIQSDVTTAAYYNRTNAETASSSFTLPALVHYSAQQGVFNSPSIVTNQYGFMASSTLVGATNNYGFRGDVVAGANNWNCYMSGTAKNYFAGNVLINDLTDNGVDKLQVGGTIEASAGTTANQVVIKSQLDLKSDLASPTFTGDPKAPTPTAGDNDTSIATTAFVNNYAPSGTYTPTLTNTANISSSSFSHAYYFRVGNMVTVNIEVLVSVTTANTLTTLTMTIPINRASSVADSVGSGTGFASGLATPFFPSFFQMATNTTQFQIHSRPTLTGNHTFVGSFTYKVD